MANASGSTPVNTLLAEDAYRLFAFVLSFTVIVRFWLVHDQMYSRVGSVSTPLLLSNFLWLLSTVFLPFPTELVANAGSRDPTAAVLYIGTMAVTTTANLLQHLVIRRSPGLRRADAGDPPASIAYLSNFGLMLAALLLAALFPMVGLWALLLLFLDAPREAVARRLRPLR